MIWCHFFAMASSKIAVVLDDRNVELRIRVSVSMSGRNFTTWNPVFRILLEITIVICEHAHGSNRMVYLGIRVTVTVSGSSSSEAYLVVKYQRYHFVWLFHLFGQEPHHLIPSYWELICEEIKVNKWAWRKELLIQHHFLCSTQWCKRCLCLVSAVSRLSKRLL